MMSSPAGISAFPESDSDLTFGVGESRALRYARVDRKRACAWRADWLRVVQGTAYEGQTYAISLSFPPTYPYAAPTVKFESTCFRTSPPSLRLSVGLLTDDFACPEDPNVSLQGDICELSR